MVRPISPRQRASGREVSACARAASAGLAASMRTAISRRNAALAAPDKAARTGAAAAARFPAVATSSAVAEWKNSGRWFHVVVLNDCQLKAPGRPRTKPR